MELPKGRMGRTLFGVLLSFYKAGFSVLGASIPSIQWNDKIQGPDFRLKKIRYEVYLGGLMLLGLLLLSTKGVERAARKELYSSGSKVEMEQQTEGAETPLSGKKVTLDPGHGGSDPGKIGINQAKEKDVNLSVAKKLKDCLEKKGIQVVMTREGEDGLYKEGDSNKKQADMKARCEIINGAKADLTVSIHQNSYTSESVSGPQVFYHAQSQEGEKAAKCLQEALNTGLEVERPRETKPNNTYYILKKTKTPVVIAECSFLSNSREAELIVTEAYQQKVAEALCEGILDYLNQTEA